MGHFQTKCLIAHVLLGHVSPLSCVAICTKLDVVVSGSQDGSICIHNIRSGKFIRSLNIDREVQESCAGNGIPIKKLAIHIDGYFVAHSATVACMSSLLMDNNSAAPDLASNSMK